jgi:hypothetical protein
MRQTPKIVRCALHAALTNSRTISLLVPVVPVAAFVSFARDIVWHQPLTDVLPAREKPMTAESALIAICTFKGVSITSTTALGRHTPAATAVRGNASTPVINMSITTLYPTTRKLSTARMIVFVRSPDAAELWQRRKQVTTAEPERTVIALIS